jgi:hypothetical protein
LAGLDTPLADNAPAGLTVRQAAALWGVSKSTAARRLARGETPAGQTPAKPEQLSPRICDSVSAENLAGTIK